MLRISQKCFVDNDTKIAYCDVKIIDFSTGFEYNVKFDNETKKRFNYYLRKLGFVVGSVNDYPPEKILEI